MQPTVSGAVSLPVQLLTQAAYMRGRVAYTSSLLQIKEWVCGITLKKRIPMAAKAMSLHTTKRDLRKEHCNFRSLNRLEIAKQFCHVLPTCSFTSQSLGELDGVAQSC